MALLTIPDLINHVGYEMATDSTLRNLQWSLLPKEAGLRQSEALNTNDLIAQLEEADLQWLPQEEVLPDGSTRYLYKRRVDEPDLSIAEIRELLESPPSFSKERQDILAMLKSLRQAGVRVLLAEPIKKGAAAEWDHAQGALRIDPKMIQKGSVDFLRVLSHEALHVAQSCKAGSLKARPKELGLAIANPEQIKKNLMDPVYANASQLEKELELEAYATQSNPTIVKRVVDRTCKVAA